MIKINCNYDLIPFINNNDHSWEYCTGKNV